jgi:hypothetical protein
MCSTSGSCPCRPAAPASSSAFRRPEAARAVRSGRRDRAGRTGSGRAGRRRQRCATTRRPERLRGHIRTASPIGFVLRAAGQGVPRSEKSAPCFVRCGLPRARPDGDPVQPAGPPGALLRGRAAAGPGGQGRRRAPARACRRDGFKRHTLLVGGDLPRSVRSPRRPRSVRFGHRRARASRCLDQQPGLRPPLARRPSRISANPPQATLQDELAPFA